jgi:hypothetical protein
MFEVTPFLTSSKKRISTPWLAETLFERQPVPKSDEKEPQKINLICPPQLTNWPFKVDQSSLVTYIEKKSSPVKQQ